MSAVVPGSVVVANPAFTQWTGNPYENDVVRATVSAIARNAAKMHTQHIRGHGGEARPVEGSRWAYLMAERPNDYTDAHTFWQRVYTVLLLEGTSYVYIDRAFKGAPPEGLYFLSPQHVTLVKAPNGELGLRVAKRGGREYLVPYEDVFHLRRDLYGNDYTGEPIDVALASSLAVLKATSDGTVNAVKQSAALRGLLKFSAMMKPEDIKTNRDQFVQDYLGIDNYGGIAATDSKAEFTELKSEPISINSRLIESAREAVYRLFGVNADFVGGNYDEKTWAAIYESVIEPMLLSTSLESTAKAFTEKERGYGNRLVCDATRLQFASVDTKTKVIAALAPYGALTVDQCLSMFNLPLLGGDEGARRLQTLNVVDATKANEYQVGETPPEEMNEEEEDEQETTES